MTSGSAHLSCQADGQWNGTLPTCRPVLCPELRTPAWSKRNSSNFTYSSVVMFGCASGFELVGSAELDCLWTGEWSNSPPKCQAVKCGSVSIANAGIVMVNDSFSGHAVFKCDIGYSSHGLNITLQCLSSGHWSSSSDSCVGECNGAIDN